ncbi:MAG: hypothetical protein Kow0010_06790 [Dehalococcoidia bacterium]
MGETLDSRQKKLVLGTLMLSLFVAALNQTVVATATPRILSDLGGFDRFSWLFTSFMLANTVVVPLVGKLSDIYGRKPFLTGGLLIFLAGSAACGAAPSMNALIAFRAIQGVGGGVIFASVFATIGELFPPAERGKYMGFFTGVFSLASIIGPTAGGFITDHFGWRWVFYVNLPIGVIAIPVILRNLPVHVRGLDRKVDYLGAALLSAASVCLLLAMVWGGQEYAWSSSQIVGLLAGFAVFLALFLGQEQRHPEPILPLHLFRNPVFLVANLLGFAIGIAMFGSISYLPTFVQTSLEASATASGIVTTPQSAGMFVASIVGGQIISRWGRYKLPAVAGTVIVFAAMLLLLQISVGMAKREVAMYMVVLGVGLGLVMPTMSLVTQNAVPFQYLGVASSASQFFRQIGGVIGAALFGAILASSYSSSFQEELPPDVRQAIPAETLAQFDNPTLALDPRSFAVVRREITALPDGEALFATATAALRESVAAATRSIFMWALGVAGVAVVLALLLKEIPLRHDFADVAAGPPGTRPAVPGVTGAAPPPGWTEAPGIAPHATSTEPHAAPVPGAAEARSESSAPP